MAVTTLCVLFIFFYHRMLHRFMQQCFFLLNSLCFLLLHLHAFEVSRYGFWLCCNRRIHYQAYTPVKEKSEPPHRFFCGIITVNSVGESIGRRKTGWKRRCMPTTKETPLSHEGRPMTVSIYYADKGVHH